MITLHNSSFWILALAAGLALHWTLTTPRELQDLPPPGSSAHSDHLRFRVELPPIRSMAHYYGSEEDSWARYNPFLTPERRRQEIAILTRPRERVRERTRDPVSPIRRSSPPPPEPREPQLAAQDLDSWQPPRVIAAILRSGQAWISVEYAGTTRSLVTGESIGPWTLEHVQDQYAWFSRGEDLLPVPLAQETSMRMQRQLADAGSGQGFDAIVENLLNLDLSHPEVRSLVSQVSGRLEQGDRRQVIQALRGGEQIPPDIAAKMLQELSPEERQRLIRAALGGDSR